MKAGVLKAIGVAAKGPAPRTWSTPDPKREAGAETPRLCPAAPGSSITFVPVGK